jgi:RNA polymerase sigma-70 factor (ECF subfamily)
MQLKYLEQKDGKEICQDLGITSSNFWQILCRAKLQVRACIEKNWFLK